MFRYPEDLAEHDRVGCRIESGEGDSLIAEPDEAPEADALPATTEPDAEPKLRPRGKKAKN